MKTDIMPKPTELMENPQLAILVVLNTAVIAATRALLAAHTVLLDDRFPRTITESDLIADRLILLGTQLVDELRKYREAVHEQEMNLPEDF